MKLTFDSLIAHLARHLRPIYCITGDEILLVQEAVDAVKAQAQVAGFSECLSFTAETGFDWQTFKMTSQNASLFSDKQCLELRLQSTKLSEAGKQLLIDYATQPPSNKLLLITAGKLDAGTQKSTWYKAIEAQGVVVPIWPLQPGQMSAFFVRRLQKVGLQADAQGIELLITRTQGNLLAAAQEIEKLSLLYPSGRLTVTQIQEASADNARFNVFDLADQMLQGDVAAMVRILLVLREEGVEPTLILWSLTRELRQLLTMAQAREAGKSLEQVSQQVWEKRKAWVKRTLSRHSRSSLWQCLQRATHIDTVIKGAEVGAVWDELSDLALAIAAP